MHFLGFLIVACTVTTSIHSAVTYDFSKYPPINQVGPAPKLGWVQKYLHSNTTTTIPTTPVKMTPALHPDWSPDITSCDNATSWAITYDDGPGPFTAGLLDHLKSVGVKVTFFVVGSRVREGKGQAAEVLLKAYKAGHQIGIHTWSHKPITLLTNEQLLGEILWTGKIIQDVIGVFPTYFRPPGGDIDDRTRAVIQSVGLKTVIWNQDSNDWFFSTEPPQQNYTEQQELQKFKTWTTSKKKKPSNLENQQQQQPQKPPGIISIQHDLFARSVKLAAPTLELVMKAGFKVMPVGQCIGDTRAKDWYTRFNDSWPDEFFKVTTSTAGVVGGGAVATGGGIEAENGYPRAVTVVTDDEGFMDNVSGGSMLVCTRIFVFVCLAILML
ncbi:hypothetical protein BDR26DRAFT_854801 [Obelidium mucronatum]|nr:hypothetical protein BDR26DRAFT_854801 [Obelidium mucronatum]